MSDAATLFGRIDGRPDLCRLHAAQRGAVYEVFIDRKIGIEGRFLGQESDMFLGLHRILSQIDTVYQHIALGLVQHTADDVHGRGFSRSVRSEKPENTVLFDRKIDVLDGPIDTVSVRQVLDFDDGSTHVRF